MGEMRLLFYSLIPLSKYLQKPGRGQTKLESLELHPGGRAEVLEFFSAASQSVLAGSWIWSPVAGTQTRAPIWDRSTSFALTCCATRLLP